ncbi:MAG: hypothetical protein QXR44_06550 [Thermoproteota archaeon]
MGHSQSIEISRFLYCSGSLEEDVAKTCRRLAEIATDIISDALNYIADDSHKHAKVLKALSKYPINADKPGFEDLEKILGRSQGDLMENPG